MSRKLKSSVMGERHLGHWGLPYLAARWVWHAVKRAYAPMQRPDHTLKATTDPWKQPQRHENAMKTQER